MLTTVFVLANFPIQNTWCSQGNLYYASMSVSNISKLLVAIIPCEQVFFSGLRSRSRGGVSKTWVGVGVGVGVGVAAQYFSKKDRPRPWPWPRPRVSDWHPSRGVSVAWLKQQHATWTILHKGAKSHAKKKPILVGCSTNSSFELEHEPMGSWLPAWLESISPRLALQSSIIAIYGKKFCIYQMVTSEKGSENSITGLTVKPRFNEHLSIKKFSI